MRYPSLLSFMFSVVLGWSVVPAARVYAEEVDRITTPALVRVRSHSPEIAVIIRTASESSPAFRRLMTSIDATDGLIYVDFGKCGHGVRACLLLAVQVAGPFRILHIKVDARRPDCRLMVDIGHELQHVIELLSDPHVTDGVTAYSFYERAARVESRSDGVTFETEAAQQAGSDVRHEVCKAAR